MVCDDEKVVAMGQLVGFQQTRYFAFPGFGIVHLPAHLDELLYLVFVLQHKVALSLFHEIGDLLQFTAPAAQMQKDAALQQLSIVLTMRKQDVLPHTVVDEIVFLQPGLLCNERRRITGHTDEHKALAQVFRPCRCICYGYG